MLGRNLGRSGRWLAALIAALLVTAAIARPLGSLLGAAGYGLAVLGLLGPPAARPSRACSPVRSIAAYGGQLAFWLLALTALARLGHPADAIGYFIAFSLLLERLWPLPALPPTGKAVVTAGRVGAIALWLWLSGDPLWTIGVAAGWVLALEVLPLLPPPSARPTPPERAGWPSGFARRPPF